MNDLQLPDWPGRTEIVTNPQDGYYISSNGILYKSKIYPYLKRSGDRIAGYVVFRDESGSIQVHASYQVPPDTVGNGHWYAQKPDPQYYKKELP